MVGTSINESDPVPPKCIMAVVATALANARGGRRGMPSMTNVLEILPQDLKREAFEDARAALDAVAEFYRDSMLEADDWISQLRNRN